MAKILRFPYKAHAKLTHQQACRMVLDETHLADHLPAAEVDAVIARVASAADRIWKEPQDLTCDLKPELNFTSEQVEDMKRIFGELLEKMRVQLIQRFFVERLAYELKLLAGSGKG